MHHLLTTATVDNLRLVASSGLSYAHFAPIGILFRLGIFPELPRFHHDSPAEPLRISLASVIATPHYRDSSGTRPSKAALLHGGAGIDLKTLRIRVRGILTAGWTSNAYHYVVPLISLLRPLTYETEIDARLELGAPVLESVGCKAGASRPLTDDAETWDYTVETRLAFPPIADLARITVRGKGAFGAQEAVEIVATVAVKLTTRGVAWMPAGSRLTAAVTGAARFSDGLDVEAGGRVLVSYQIRGPE
jgi:hypothetical protein